MVTVILLDADGGAPRQRWQFPEDQRRIRVGRLEDNEIALSSYPEVSRHHLDFQRGPQGWELISYGANGTFVQGQMVQRQGIAASPFLCQLARGGPVLQLTWAAIPPTCNHEGNVPKALFCRHCGAPLGESDRQIRQYRILKILGQGGMGTTFIAMDRHHNGPSPRLVVLKEMNADMAQIAKAQELFNREAHVLQSLNHPGIPPYYDFFVEQDKKYLVMGLVHGENLEQLIYRQGPVTPAQAIGWLGELCDILTYLHHQTPPIIHRDIKPANLIRQQVDGRIILLDFGAVKEVGTPAGTRIGSEGYSAPEQTKGQPFPQSDLYAVGATLIFLLTGQAPLAHYHYDGRIYRFAVEGVPSIPRAIAQVIHRVTAPAVGDRFATAAALKTALVQCLR